MALVEEEETYLDASDNPAPTSATEVVISDHVSDTGEPGGAEHEEKQEQSMMLMKRSMKKQNINLRMTEQSNREESLSRLGYDGHEVEIWFQARP